MNGFEKRANQIKEKIKKTTLDMLKTTDPKGMRIADIAKLAEVSQVTIYNYFGSKDALVRDAFKGYFEKAVTDFEAYLNEGHPLREMIERIIALEKDTYRDFSPSLVKQLVVGDPELTAFVDAVYRERTIPMTVRMIEEGKASGEISEEVTVENVLAFMQIYMNQYEALLEMAAKSADRERFLEGMVHMFFYGLCGKR